MFQTVRLYESNHCLIKKICIQQSNGCLIKQYYTVLSCLDTESNYVALRPLLSLLLPSHNHSHVHCISVNINFGSLTSAFVSERAESKCGKLIHQVDSLSTGKRKKVGGEKRNVNLSPNKRHVSKRPYVQQRRTTLSSKEQAVEQRVRHSFASRSKVIGIGSLLGW